MKLFNTAALFLLILSSTAAAAIDPETGPAIVLTVPVENAGEVSTLDPIVVQFSTDIDPRTLHSGTFSVEGADGTVRYDPELKSAAWTPNSPLEPWKTYTVTLSDEIKDLDGRPLSFAYRWTFTTRSDAEPEGPLAVQRTVPEANEAHVAVETAVSVTFNKEVDPITVRPDAVTLTGGEPIEGRLYYDPDSRTIFFSPSAPLEFGRTYTAIVKEGIEDRSGNPLLFGAAWSFTTETPPEPRARLFP